MRRKKILIIIFIIIGILLMGLGIGLFINNKRNLKIEKEYQTYLSNSIDAIKNNKKINIKNNKNKGKKIINDYLNKIKEEKDNIEQLSYDEFKKNNDINKIFTDLDKLKEDVENQNNLLNKKEKEFIELNSHKSLISYLEDKKCDKLCISAIKQIDKSKVLDDYVKDFTKQSYDNYNKLLDYINYLKENKEIWFLENDVIKVKNDDAINNINSKNSEFGITTKIEKYVEPKVSVESNSQNKINSPKITIFMYHGVSDNPWGITSLFMPIAKFDEQMKYLHDNGYKTIFADEIESVSDYSKTVMLTFDDGYTDFYDNALPILKKYNIKANLYVISNYMGANLYASAAQVKEISDSGLVMIGSHTYSHPSLNQLSDADIERELRDSKNTLEGLLGKEVNTIAYPSGHYDNRVLEITKKYYKYGYLAGTGIQSMGSNFNNVMIKRVGLYSSVSFNSFVNYCKQSG